MSNELFTASQILPIWNRYNALIEHRKDNRLEFVDYARYPEQTKVIDLAVNRVLKHVGPKFIVVWGGNQSGKSEAGAIVVSRVFHELPGSRILGATIETKLSINVQQRKYAQYLKKRELKYGDYNPVRGWANNIIIGKEEQHLLLKTYAQGYEAFQGDEYDLIHLDEEPPWDVFQECIMRTVKRDGCILMTFTSLEGFTRIVNMLWGSPSPDVNNTILDLYMNPYISKESKDTVAANIDPDDVESRIHGKPHLKQGLIYKEFGEIHKVKVFDYADMVMKDPQRFELHEGIDPHNRTPHHWIRFMYDTKKDIVYVVDELKAPKESMLISDFARLIRIKRGVTTIRGSQVKVEMKPRFTQIDTSAMTPEVVQVAQGEDQEQNLTIRIEFSKNGIQTVLVHKDNSVGINAVKDRLKVVRAMDGTVKRLPKLYVFETCVGTIWEFGRYSWDSYTSEQSEERKEQINSPMKKNDHFMDLIKYEAIKIHRKQQSEVKQAEEEPMYGEIGY